MDPIPKMLIQTPAATKKGELWVDLATVDELITQLVIAKTGLIGAQSAIGAKGAMDAAREVEAQRAADVDATVFCGARSPWGEECVLEEHAGLCMDAADRTWCRECDGKSGRHKKGCARTAVAPAVPVAGDEDGWPAPCPSCHQRDEHADGCERDAQLTRIGEQVQALSQPAPARVLTAGEADCAGSIVYLACGDQLDGNWQADDAAASELSAGTPVPCPRHGTTVVLTVNEYMDRATAHLNDPGPLASVTPSSRPATSELLPLDESLPWADSAASACGWHAPDDDRCQLKPHSPRDSDHHSRIGAASMRRWAALKAVGS